MRYPSAQLRRLLLHTPLLYLSTIPYLVVGTRTTTRHPQHYSFAYCRAFPSLLTAASAIRSMHIAALYYSAQLQQPQLHDPISLRLLRIEATFRFKPPQPAKFLDTPCTRVPRIAMPFRYLSLRLAQSVDWLSTPLLKTDANR